MEGYPLKLKRKDLEDVNNDFSDFPLSSPATKIRRLDAELPPRIIEEPECEIPVAFEHSLLPERMRCDESLPGIRIEELPVNNERAIVLFNPTTLPRAPSNLTVSVDHHFISALKNQVPRSNHPIPWRLGDDEAAENNNTSLGDGCLAVVPWVPSKFPSEARPELPSQANSFEMMDAQEVEEEEMDIEDVDVEQRNVNGMSITEGFHQWRRQQQQQQHCLVPQPPYNATSPIVWYQ